MTFIHSLRLNTKLILAGLFCIIALIMAQTAHGQGPSKDDPYSTEGDPAPSGGAEFLSVRAGPDIMAGPIAVDGRPDIERPGPAAAQISTTFDGFGFDENGTEIGTYFIPPDPIGAAGPDRLIAVVNVMIEARGKTGTLLWRDSLRDFFAPLGAATLGTFGFDPKVIYDQYEDRFVVVALERTDIDRGDPADESRILVAVSRSATPASPTAADWYYIAIDSAATIGGIPHWADYPGFEVDEEAVYITNNMFSFSSFGGLFGGVRLWIIDKGVGSSGFYDGGPATIGVYDPYAGGGIETTTMPAHVFGAGGIGPGIGTFLVSYSGISNGSTEAIQVIRIDDPLGTPLFSQEYVDIGDIEGPSFPSLPDAPQNGTTTLIEVNDRRALDAVWRDNALWLVATILPNSGPDANETTAHWVRLDTSAAPGGPITLADQGNIGGEDIHPAGDVSTFFPSIAVNSAGDAAFGFAASSPAIYGGAYAAQRDVTDPPGTVGATQVVRAGVDYYIRTFGGPRNRWGDYSGIALDPTNDDTYWVFNEWADQRGTIISGEDGRWGTTWASLISLPFALQATPTVQSVCAPADAVYNLTVDQATTFTDPVALSASGQPAGTTTVFSINPVSPPGTSQLTIGNTGAAAPGSYSIDIQGVNSGGTVSTTVQLGLVSSPPTSVTLSAPADGAVEVSRTPALSWSGGTLGENYDLEIATDPTFTPVVYSATVTETSHTVSNALSPETTHYWRVRANNVCGQSAFSVPFSFTTRANTPILLVDDDDNAPDVRSIYTDVLDGLIGSGNYDIWDTNNSDNEPDLSTLSQYDAVVWFTGVEFGGFAGPGAQGETALAAYLETGSRCLLISSQDYHYDRGLTSFMQTYLGVASVTNDISQVTVSGEGSVFTGLGPYALVYPFSNFSDIVNPAASAELAFLGDAGNAAINRDGGAYRTAFFGFPFEALPTATDRETVMTAWYDWCAPALPVAPVLTISASGADIGLNWTDDAANASYEVHRSTAPFFTPLSGTLLLTLPGGTTAFTDTGAAGNVATNYFYQVQALNGDGSLSAGSNEVGEIDFALNNAGDLYSLITLPFSTTTITNAARLASAIGDVGALLNWNRATQAFRFFVPPATGDNFALIPGEVVFVQLNSGGPNGVTMVGDVTAVQYSLAPGGFNFISLPLQRDDLTDAASVALDITNINSMLSWNETTQTFRLFVPPGTGDNFALQPGRPFVIDLGPGGPSLWP